MKYKFLLASEITDIDIRENISPDCIGIFLYGENNWIELLPVNDWDKGIFFVPDGWASTHTNDFHEAEAAMFKFIEDNK